MVQLQAGESQVTYCDLCRCGGTNVLNLHCRTRFSPDGGSGAGIQRYLPRILFPFKAQLDLDWSTQVSRQREAYEDASSIDWSYEDARERSRMQELSELRGMR